MYCTTTVLKFVINFQCVLSFLQIKIIIIQTHLGTCEIVSPASMSEKKTDSGKTIAENTSDKEATQSKFLFYSFSPQVGLLYITLIHHY